jgi:RES domain-containing protein
VILEVYRLHSKRYPANSGKGAALHGGRWNPPGVEAIYTAQSRSLAALEILVHYTVLPRDFVLTPIRIPEDRVVVARLQTHWQFSEAQTRDLGLEWFGRTAVLGVYSFVIPEERIYILNPSHPEFEYIEFLASEPFQFDPRLKQIV